ncbi:MAG: DUF1761 domain-containing protein [Candidatus Doudnabacteria bacterium]|nr:DUF1761 domain-containing protein [Candidatus Doudnabacteria bacterium]
MPVVPINYLAVLVCGVAAMLLGFLYFGPLFGKLYSRLMGFDAMDPLAREELKKGMGKSYMITFVGSLVTAWVLAHAIIYAGNYMHWSGLTAGLATGFMSWLGFMATVTLGNVLWGRQSWKLWTLSNGHNLLQLLVFGAILGTWK